MSDKQFPTLIHERVDMAQRGENKTVIGRLPSGWVVLGDDQRLRGYTLLLSDPVVDNLHSLDIPARTQFLTDMALIGDALIEVLNPSIMNYSILGNTDRALHVHIHPRYDDEKPEHRRTHAIIYHWEKHPVVSFDLERDRPLMDEIRKALAARTELLD